MRSPQRGGLLREKLLRLAPPTEPHNAQVSHGDQQADSQPGNVPATETERKGDDERGGGKIHTRGDSGTGSRLDAVAGGQQGVEEAALLSDGTGASKEAAAGLLWIGCFYCRLLLVLMKISSHLNDL